MNSKIMLSNAVVLKETNEPIGSVGIMFCDGVHSADMQEGECRNGNQTHQPQQDTSL